MRTIRLAFAFVFLFALPAIAQQVNLGRIPASRLPDCVAGRPMEAWILDSSSTSTCSRTSTGSSEAHCCCSNAGWAACGGGVTDHGGLTGLGDDDHTQYALLAGRASSQTLQGVSTSSGSLYLRSDSTGSYAQLELTEIVGNSVGQFTLDSSTWNFQETQGTFFNGSATVFSVDGTALGGPSRLRLGDAGSDASSTCIGRSAFDWLWHDTDCDGAVDAGEDDLSSDDDVPESGDFGALALTGDVSSSGLTTTIGANKVLESHLKAVDTAADEQYLTYETTTGDFEWETGNELDQRGCFAGSMVRVAGTGSETVAGKSPVVQLLDAETGEWACFIELSQEDQSKTFDLYLMMTPSTTSTCNWYLTARWKSINDAANIAVSYGADGPTAVASSGTANIADFYDTATDWSVPSNIQFAVVTVERQGSHASDTCSNVLWLSGIVLVEQAN